MVVWKLEGSGSEEMYTDGDSILIIYVAVADNLSASYVSIQSYADSKERLRHLLSS